MPFNSQIWSGSDPSILSDSPRGVLGEDDTSFGMLLVIHLPSFADLH